MVKVVRGAHKDTWLMNIEQIAQRAIEPVLIDQGRRRNMESRQQHQNLSVNPLIAILTIIEGIDVADALVRVPSQTLETPAVAALGEFALEDELIEQVLALKQRINKL